MSTMDLARDAGTISGVARGRRIPGWVSSQQLLGSPVYFDAGPTGRSVLWPEQLSTLMFEAATTDPGFNRVDLVWMGDEGTIVYVEISAPALSAEAEISVPPLDEVVTELRARLGMSVDDVAAMCGVGRRQLYNLMSGSTTRTSQEAHIRRLAAHVDALWQAVDGSPQRLRSIALHPVDGTTFYEAAVAHDSTRMSLLARDLVDAVEAGQLRGAIRRPSPRRRRQARPGAIAELYGDDHDA
jgi:transcriptional regulator with XRE-family HTH domain